ncbi:hypothetical protein AGMMS49928_26610 [Spirochaetia bacterium]|nr:hypothetical protein AGMMS49928_26610 [Spirochaetia bacterium]
MGFAERITIKGKHHIKNFLYHIIGYTIATAACKKLFFIGSKEYAGRHGKGKVFYYGIRMDWYMIIW